MARVLITSGWLRSSYAVLRNLKKHNFEVFVADAVTVGMCQFSLKKNGFDLYTSHYISETQFISDIIRICKKRNIDVLIPSHDETEILSKYKSKLPKELCTLLPEFDQCTNFNNKSKSYEIALSNGVPVPKRLDYDINNLKRKLANFHTSDVVIKLLKGNSSKGVFYSRDETETFSKVIHLIKKYRLDPERYPQIEERVDGEGWGSSFLFFEGVEIASFTHRRLREKIQTGGTSTLRRQAYNAEVEKYARQILTKVSWNGFAMCEFKVCPETKKVWFIEINPRLWGSLPLSVDAGVEFPFYAALCGLNKLSLAKAEAKSAKIKEDWCNRWLLGDLASLLKNLVLFDLNAIKSYFSNTKADASDDWHLDDPFVFLGEFLNYAITAVKHRSFNAARRGMLK